jgi:hypothetical protein
VVCGSLVLVGGEPGVGKSTLSLQIAAMLAQPDLDYDALAPSAASDSEDSFFASGASGTASSSVTAGAIGGNADASVVRGAALDKRGMSPEAAAASSGSLSAVIGTASAPAARPKQRRSASGACL